MSFFKNFDENKEAQTLFNTLIKNEREANIAKNEFDIEWEEDHIISYKYPRMYALRRPTWEINPTRSIDDFKVDNVYIFYLF